MPDLATAVATELELRAELAGLVQRSRALRDEAGALRRRAALADADPRVPEAADRLEVEASRLDDEVEPLRLRVRQAEGAVALLRAEALGA